MPIYRPVELKAFLNSLSINARKSLSQNFLIDGNIIKKIVNSADLTSDDLVLEIGSGPGALTEEFLERGAQVIAIEKDNTLAPELRRLEASEEKLQIFHQDITKVDLEAIIKARLKPGQKVKVIASIPYQITSPIITALAPMYDIISKVVIVIQDEVAKRCTAKPGNKSFSSLTLFLNYYSKPRYAFVINKSCFYPAPKVDSAVLSLDLIKPRYDKEETEKLFDIIHAGFQKRRKTLKASLKDLYTPAQTEKALLKLGLNSAARPEELSLDQFCALFEELKPI